MNNNIKNISFTSNIRFVSQNGLERLLMANKSTVQVKEMHQINQVEKVRETAETGGIIFCIAGLLKNISNNTNYIFHWWPRPLFDPTHSKFNQAENNLIQKKITELKSNKIKGVLMGGIIEKDSIRTKMSKRLLALLINPHKKNKNADFTIFFGQKNSTSCNRPESGFFYHEKNDTYYVSVLDERCRNLLAPQAIKNQFSFIQISPNDKLFIGRNQIPNEFWAKSEIPKK